MKDTFPSFLKRPVLSGGRAKKTLFQKTFFPGYIFIESYKPATEFIQHVFPIVYKQKESYRFLCYGDKSEIAMRDEERIALSRVLGDDRKIGISIGFKEGDSVRVISGPLESNESKIMRINKKRHEAITEIAMFGGTVPMSVGIEVIEKIPKMLFGEGRMKMDETNLHTE